MCHHESSSSKYARHAAENWVHPDRTPSGSFCQVPVSSFYQAAVTSPAQLAVTPSVGGTVTAYIATAGQGTIVVSDNSSATCT